ncbi:methionine gamma-lyase [Pacificimonas flava]|uniref:Methionine gamma-lyase n=2 Tax=Pacificimonas TaxID=1960290 RepID=A0A219B3S5_9SPHN|nr:MULTISPECIES: cystathionine gamma-synthase family protein [Pacificimonas]MBZ6377284.1 cystathionine gamma-synthase family protein [Pacificimonas aurantium]OWV33005.1 methionine gamma-lyase [Pacificimonas flava]
MEDDPEKLDEGRPSRQPTPPQVTELGGRQLHPSTLMMGYGYEPRLSEGALKPPIFLTSTYAFESAADGKRFFEGITGKRPGGSEGLVYGRFNGPNQEILEDRLAQWERAEEALSFSSGMSAIGTSLMAHVQPGDVIVHSAPLYAATEKMIDSMLGKFGVTWADFPAHSSPEDIRTTIEAARGQGRVSVIYLESPANPTNDLVDIEAVAAIRDELFADAEHKPVIMCDNTFLGPCFQSPTLNGADISLYSLTKYVGGHSDLVAGACVGSREALAPILALRNTLGTITDPNTAWMLLRSLETVQLRMEKAESNARAVGEFLRDHPKVERVSWLGFLDPSSSQGEIYKRHCTGAGSTFSVIVKGGEPEAFRLLDNLRTVKLAVSLGGTESLASHPAAMTHLSVPEDRRAELGISDNLVRVSIGVEHEDDLIADFDQALKAV